ncbi:hypothetical protein [Frankia gtarii]|uniref:hypothetical protein n=1 Tax=Frankia gtarii TaxID=2950102 RepID=UPI0021BFFCA7|nr:hypothetical protein [Frankia gtarii]
MTEQRRVMILGAGDLGARVLHGLARADDRMLQLVGRDPEAVPRAANLAALSGLQTGHHPAVSWALTDLADVDRTAEVISRFRPDVLFLAASLQSWWVISALPKPAFDRISAAKFGPWLPMHVVPVYRAMRAVRAAGSHAVVVNAAYPDAVHPMLAPHGLSPHVGIGNVANNVPGTRCAAADALAAHVREVDVRLVAHHYVSHRLSRHGDAGEARMALRVLHRGVDVTDRLDIPVILGALNGPYRRTSGRAGQDMTAASALSVLEPLIDQRDALVHAPGPAGRVGGYPLRLANGAIQLALPDAVGVDEAREINLSGQRADGIREIGPDGTVRFESWAAAVLYQETGYDGVEMPLDRAEDCARELAGRFAAYRGQVERNPGYQSVAGGRGRGTGTSELARASGTRTGADT